MKLYYTPGACSLAVRIVINELGIPCSYEKVDLRSKKTEHGNDFYKINPKGYVPTLEIKPGEILTENAAIQQYLADTHHNTILLPAVNDMRRYRVLELLSFINTELHKGSTLVFNSKLSTDVKENILKPNLKNKLVLTNQLVGNKSFLFENNFTLADAYLFVVLSWMPHLEIEMTEYPNLVRYFEGLKKRPSIIKSLQEEQLVS